MRAVAVKEWQKIPMLEFERSDLPVSIDELLNAHNFLMCLHVGRFSIAALQATTSPYPPRITFPLRAPVLSPPRQATFPLTST